MAGMIRSYGVSKIGLVREANEDCIFAGEDAFFILADGMGGYEGGQTASHLAVETVRVFLAGKKPEDYGEDVLQEAISEANFALLAKKRENADLAMMGTTLTAAAVSGDFLYWGHVGDSRLYILENGTLRQLTTDHTYVMTLYRDGKISKEGMRRHPRKNELMRAVGVDAAVKIDTGKLALRGSALCLLCSDGVSSCVTDEELLQILREHGSTRESLACCAEKIINKVYAAGAADNTSAILVSIEP